MLDAARACVLAVGVRRTTFSDVARRAGVSRMTLYRRFPDLETLLSALMTREFGRLVADARRRGAEGAAPRARGGDGHRTAARRLHADPLFDRLLDVDPELLLPYVTLRLGGMQRMASPGWPRSSRPDARRLGARRATPEVLGARDRADRARVRAGRARRPELGPVGRARPRRRRVPAAVSALAERRAPRRGARRARRRRGRRRRRRRRRHHRRRASRSTPRRAGCRSRCSSGATSRTARAAGARSSSTAGCATSSTATSGSAWESARRARPADAHDRAAPRPPAAVRDPARRRRCPPHGREDASRPADRRRAARRRPHEPRACSRRRGAISALEARRLAPALAAAGLRGALLSWDGQLEDDARLVVAVARTAAAHGARMLTYAGSRARAPTASTRSTG